MSVNPPFDVRVDQIRQSRQNSLLLFRSASMLNIVAASMMCLKLANGPDDFMHDGLSSSSNLLLGPLEQGEQLYDCPTEEPVPQYLVVMDSCTAAPCLFR